MPKINREKKCIAVILSLCLCFCQIQGMAVRTVYAAEYAKTAVVSEIDLGDYQSQMAVGEKQLLSVTILPEEAGGRKRRSYHIHYGNCCCDNFAVYIYSGKEKILVLVSSE